MKMKATIVKGHVVVEPAEVIDDGVEEPNPASPPQPWENNKARY